MGGSTRCLEDDGHEGRHRHNDGMAFDLIYVDEIGYWVNIKASKEERSMYLYNWIRRQVIRETYTHDVAISE
jgi:hypothetical protein